MGIPVPPSFTEVCGDAFDQPVGVPPLRSVFFSSLLSRGRRAAITVASRARQIDRNGRWTIKRGRKVAPPEGAQRQAVGEIAMPAFGDKKHIGIDRSHGYIRRFTVTHRGANSERCLSISAMAHTIMCDRVTCIGLSILCLSALGREKRSGLWMCGKCLMPPTTTG